jgi:hypothetical protein
MSVPPVRGSACVHRHACRDTRRAGPVVDRRPAWPCRHDIGPLAEDDEDDQDDDDLSLPCDFLDAAEAEPGQQQEQALLAPAQEGQPQPEGADPALPIKPGEMVEHPMQVATDFPFKQSESWSLSRWVVTAALEEGLYRHAWACSRCCCSCSSSGHMQCMEAMKLPPALRAAAECMAFLAASTPPDSGSMPARPLWLSRWRCV